MGASAGEDWDSFIDRMCRLETENAKLKEINKEMQGALEYACDSCEEVLGRTPKCTSVCILGKALRKARGETE